MSGWVVVGMTASLHKLTAGSGYEYLTRQVAAHDTTERGYASLASYYSERGEVPGTWRGRGVARLGDLAVGDVVTAEQMRALFGGGFHPNMQARLDALPAGAVKAMVEEASRLGQPFLVFEAATEFRRDVEDGIAQWRVDSGVSASVVVPKEVRAEILSTVASERFEARIGRPPSPEELGAEVARWSRAPTTACAGFDLTFTPVKSVSALWALAPKPVAAAIERAHDAAVDDALRYLEGKALFSRAGAGGVRQIDVHGLVAASFTHRDSRAGDPNLHTHVAIANKVQGLDGKWRAIDGRLIFKARVAVSETYNTQLEAHLREALGLEFVEREPGSPDRRAVREVAGVPHELRDLWSSRRRVIEHRQGQLALEFQHRHGRPPTPVEAIGLAQQANLETGQAKHEPRSLDEQRATWHHEATQLLSPAGIQRMLRNVIGRATPPRRGEIPETMLDQVAGEVVARVAHSRATWQVWHLRGEASRRARPLATTAQEAEQLTQAILHRALAQSLPVGPGGDGIEEPALLRRRDGTSMYEVAGLRLFTSQEVIDAEARITAAANQTDGRRTALEVVEIALLESVANGITLNPGQRELVRSISTSGQRVQLALAAAGTGKTTAMRVLARAWEESGGTILGLAPSAAAAAVLGDATNHPATTLAKLLWDHHHGRQIPVDASTLIILDEAGMTDTLALAELVDLTLTRGASIRLVGDTHQLSAIGAGGVLRDLERDHGAVRLDEVLRFTDDGEKAASLALRDGDPAALGWYLDHDRIHAGSHESTLDAALRAWVDDTQRGLDSLMVAGTRDQVAELNHRARQHLYPEEAVGRTVELSDGNQASVGDLVLTRRNDRRLRASTTGWVKNGDRWSIQHIHQDGSLSVRHRPTHHAVTLPAGYVAQHVELGYATTVHTAQGVTVDTTHTILTGDETRQQLYVAATRGRQSNHLHVSTVDLIDDDAIFHPTTLRPPTAVEIIETILAHDDTARSVTTELTHANQPEPQLADAVNSYRDALTHALEHHHQHELQELDTTADQILPGLTEYPAWPTLRQHLLFTTNPTAELQRAAASGHRWTEIHDPAALLATLIPQPTGGPLPWLPHIPQPLHTDHTWGPYLQARAQRITTLTEAIRTAALAAPPPPWLPIKEHIPANTIAEVTIWRAATGVEHTDRRPTGEPGLLHG